MFEHVAAAQAWGEVSEAQARLITRTIEKLPDAVRDEHGQWLEEFLVGNAGQFDPLVLGRLATRAVSTFDPDGVLADAAYRERVRELVVQVRPDGSSHVCGDLTAEATEYLLVAMDALAGPQPVDDGTNACCVDHRDRLNEGWTTTMINGRPHWTPPRWLDASQTPRHNTWNDL